MSLPLTYIIIINWNNWPDTLECLQSIENNTYPNYQIVIIDNNSQNDSLSKIKDAIKTKTNITSISSDKNLGFAGGSNLGIKYALNKGAEYILLLNNDTVVEKEFLKELISTAEKEENTGIVGGIIYYYPKNKIWFQGGKISWLKGGGIHSPKDREELVLKDGEHKVDFITGCLMLIKRSAIEKIGLLDESYFLYSEDTDFCARAKKANIKMVINTRSIIYHKENSKINGWQPYHIYYVIRNRLIFMKRFAPNYIILTGFYSLALIGGMGLSLKWLLTNRFDLIKAAFSAGKDFIKRVTGQSQLYL